MVILYYNWNVYRFLKTSCTKITFKILNKSINWATVISGWEVLLSTLIDLQDFLRLCKYGIGSFRNIFTEAFPPLGGIMQLYPRWTNTITVGIKFPIIIISVNSHFKVLSSTLIFYGEKMLRLLDVNKF